MNSLILMEKSNLLADDPLLAWVLVHGETGDKYHIAWTYTGFMENGGLLHAARRIREIATEKGWPVPAISTAYISMFYDLQAWEKEYDALRKSLLRRLRYRVSLVGRLLLAAGDRWLRRFVHPARSKS